MIEYVLDIAVDKFNQVLLVRKNKPKWQEGKLNFPGGKVESYDTDYAAAMVREWREETGLESTSDDWETVANLIGPDWKMVVMKFVSDDVVLNFTSLHMMPADSGEHLEILDYQCLTNNSECISNLGALIGLAYDDTRSNYRIET